jgi:uncharacterized protein YybS (DUF2232 family)
MEDMAKTGHGRSLAADWIAYTIAAILLQLVSMVLPPLALLLPLPALLLFMKRGKLPALSSLFAAVVVMVMWKGHPNIYHLLILAVGGVSAVIAAEMTELKLNIRQISAVIVLLPLVLTPMLILGFNMIYPVSVDQLLGDFYERLDTTVSEMQERNGAGESEKARIEEMLYHVKWIMTNLHPAIYAVSAVTAIFVCLFLAGRYVRKKGRSGDDAFRFGMLEYPELLILLFVISTIGYLTLMGFGAFVSSNLLVFVLFLYFLLGLSLLVYSFDTFKVMTGVRILMYLSIFLLPVLPLLLIALGMVNVRFPIRKKIAQLKEKLSQDS